MPTNTHFAAALTELVEKRPVHGLFARCFAEADGDEAKTRARYIALRAIEIEQDERASHEMEVEELRRREATRAEELREREMARRRLRDTFTFEQFWEEYRGEISLNYYGWKEQQDMFEQWRKQKVEAILGVDDSVEAPPTLQASSKMQKSKLAAITFTAVASFLAITRTVNSGSLDYQEHPVASIAGSLMPGLIIGGVWFFWPSRKKQ